MALFAAVQGGLESEWNGPVPLPVGLSADKWAANFDGEAFLKARTRPRVWAPRGIVG